MAEQDEAKQPCLKPSWAIAPAWAKWLCQDRDGDWFWWSTKPVHHEDSMSYWMPAKGKVATQWDLAVENTGRTEFSAWKSTLERRPSRQEGK